MKYIIKPPSSIYIIVIGFIIQCKDKDDFGVLYSVNLGYQLRQPYKDLQGKLYFFHKDSSFKLEKYSIVSSILKSTNNCIEVCDVKLLSDFNEYYPNEDFNEEYRENNRYHFENEWNLMKEGRPYYSIEDINLTINHPIKISDTIIEYNSCTLYNILSIENVEKSLLGCYFYLKKYDKDMQSLSPDIIKEKIDKIYYDIKNFDINKEILKFISGTGGYFQHRPGKDDLFIITTFRKTESTDEYISSLGSLKKEIDTYTCNGRGSENEDFFNLDEEDTERLRNEVRNNYNINKHFLFHLNKTIEDISILLEKYFKAKSLIYTFINKEDKDILNKDFLYQGLEQYIKFINKNLKRI